MSIREPDAEAAERLTAAARRVVDLVRRTSASGEAAEQALAALERAADLLEPHAHPGPWAQRTLSFEGAFTPIGDAPRDFAGFFPYSPLIGPRNPLAPPAEFEIRDGRVHGRVRFGAPYVGPPATVHGGVIAAMFDELLGCANLANEVGGMTGTLRVKYVAPTPIGEELRLEAWVDRVEGRKVFTRGTIHHGDTLSAEAEGVFVQGSMQRFVERLAAAARSEAD
jgi:acyl-coenzyme A thioesterase PaaI-like protein